MIFNFHKNKLYRIYSIVFILSIESLYNKQAGINDPAGFFMAQ
jgi:hypothetical protein